MENFTGMVSSVMEADDPLAKSRLAKDIVFRNRGVEKFDFKKARSWFRQMVRKIARELRAPVPNVTPGQHMMLGRGYEAVWNTEALRITFFVNNTGLVFSAEIIMNGQPMGIFGGNYDPDDLRTAEDRAKAERKILRLARGLRGLMGKDNVSMNDIRRIATTLGGGGFDGGGGMHMGRPQMFPRGGGGGGGGYDDDEF